LFRILIPVPVLAKCAFSTLNLLYCITAGPNGPCACPLANSRWPPAFCSSRPCRSSSRPSSRAWTRTRTLAHPRRRLLTAGSSSSGATSSPTSRHRIPAPPARTPGVPAAARCWWSRHAPRHLARFVSSRAAVLVSDASSHYAVLVLPDDDSALGKKVLAASDRPQRKHGRSRCTAATSLCSASPGGFVAIFMTAR